MKNNTRDRYRGALLGLLIGDILAARDGQECKQSVSDFGLDAVATVGLSEHLVGRAGTLAGDDLLHNWEGASAQLGAPLALRNPLVTVAPAVMARLDPSYALLAAREQCALTHSQADTVSACELFAAYLWRALNEDGDKVSVVAPPRYTHIAYNSHLMAIACGSFRFVVGEDATPTEGERSIEGTLECAMMAFWRGYDFAGAVSTALAYGRDVAAITGQIAGAFYGASAIPDAWVRVLPKRCKFEALADRLHDLAYPPALSRSLVMSAIGGKPVSLRTKTVFA